MPRAENLPCSRFWTDKHLASRLGKSVAWLRQHRGRLKTEGLPLRDPLLGYDSALIEGWLDKRSGIRSEIDLQKQQEEQMLALLAA